MLVRNWTWKLTNYLLIMMKNINLSQNMGLSIVKLINLLNGKIEAENKVSEE